MTIDWKKGQWRRGGATSTEGAPGAAAMTFASDWAPIRAYETRMIKFPERVYGDVLPLLRESDWNIFNVECVFDEGSPPIPKAGPALRGGADVARQLRGRGSVPIRRRRARGVRDGSMEARPTNREAAEARRCRRRRLPRRQGISARPDAVCRWDAARRSRRRGGRGHRPSSARAARDRNLRRSTSADRLQSGKLRRQSYIHPSGIP